MNTTIFLAQLWGPVLMAVAFGVFVSKSYYIKMYRDLEKDALAVLVFGLLAMTAGIAQVLVHSVWGTLPEGVISFLGWGTLLKGALFIVTPGVVDKGGDMWVDHKLVPYAGGLMLVLGGYLTWFAYFA